MPEPWVCAGCRSINEARAARCYKCRSPRDAATFDPLSSEPTAAPSVPTAPKADLTHVVSTMQFAAISGISIVSVLIVHGFNLLTATDLIGRLVSGGTIGRLELALTNVATLVELGLVAIAVLAWASWASSVIGNVPRLGIAYPDLTPRWAFFEHIIPGVNVFRAPAVMYQLLGHFPGKSGRDEGLFATWVGALLAAVVLPRILSSVIGFVIQDPDQRQRIIDILAWGVYAGLIVAAVAAILLLARIEGRQAAKVRELASGAEPAPMVAA